MYFIESEYLENVDSMKAFYHYEQAVKYMKKAYKKEKNLHSWQWAFSPFSVACVRDEKGIMIASVNNRGIITIYSWNF